MRGGRLSRSGFTLMELVVSLTIIGIVLGAGLGFVSSFDPGANAARGLVVNALRQARNDAIARRAPASVRLDPADGSVTARGYAVAGTWRFEPDAMGGAGDLPMTLHGFDGQSATTERGHIGDALDLTRGSGGCRMEVDLSEDPIFRLRDGFRLRLALRASELRSGQVIDLGETLTLDVAPNGGLEVEVVTLASDEVGRARRGAKVRLLSPPGLLVPGRWRKIELRYDRRALCILADGVEVARRPESRALAPLDGPMVIGDRRAAFQGQVDDVVLSVARQSERVLIPGTAVLGMAAPLEVWFDGTGQLDPVQHPAPVEIDIEGAEGVSVGSVRVLRAGTVQ